MTLEDLSVQKFLATKEVAVLATVQPDGSPLAMPMWFLPDPVALTMISVDGLQKVRNLRRDSRGCGAGGSCRPIASCSGSCRSTCGAGGSSSGQADAACDHGPQRPGQVG